MKTRKFKIILFLIAFFFYLIVTKANNVNLSNVSITGQNVASHFTMIQADISWDNSWRTSTLENNWDAIWLFAKYRLKYTNVWHHVTFNTGGHTAPSGSVITAPTDGKGVFIYKSSNGIGTNTWAGAQLRWNYGVDGLLDTNLVEVCLYAIEMVYIPQGSFYLGDGSTGVLQAQFAADVSGVPFLLSSEAAITLGGGSSGSLGNTNLDGMDNAGLDDFDDVAFMSLPLSFPKGFNAFYMMKYEITQEQYVEFLNKLTYTQQVSRTAVAPNSAIGTGALSNTKRNGIDIFTPGINATTPAVYACNYNGNGMYNEAGDGHNIPCNFLSWADLAAYLDWAGLRPFTEFEYEKTCRGINITPVPDEYAWGNTTIAGASGISNAGFTNELASNASGNVVYSDTSGVQGPLRVGCFAKSTTNRQTSGATYYGIMEMSGNVWEKAVTAANPTGRAFTGLQGDGVLSAAGNANTANWPPSNAVGSGLRGGGYEVNSVSLRISAREFAGWADPIRLRTYGGRGARTAP